MERRWLGLFAVVATALGSAGCPPPAPPPIPAPQSVKDVKLVSSQAGESVLVFAAARVGGGLKSTPLSYVYLRRRSLETGALLASVELRHDRDRLVFGHDWTCEPALRGRLWCLEGPEQGLTLRDTESLQIVAVQGRILGGTPELAGEPLLSDMRVDPKTRGFVFESRDGYAWIVDPTTLAPARFAGSIRSIPRPGEALPDNPAGVTNKPMQGYSFDDETRKTLHRDGKPLHPEHTYLRGKLVENRDGLLVLDDPPRLLVVEEAVDHGFTLWSVLADGTPQWKLTDLPGPLMDAKLYRDTVLLVTKSKLVAVRTQYGAVVWSSPP